MGTTKQPFKSPSSLLLKKGKLNELKEQALNTSYIHVSSEPESVKGEGAEKNYHYTVTEGKTVEIIGKIIKRKSDKINGG